TREVEALKGRFLPGLEISRSLLI
ncbi:hypothetical protein CCACVL1_00828, partial [Corchorus capsularis]